MSISEWVSPCGKVRLYNADCRDVLPLVDPAETCITDPPYELGFMGKKWDGTGVAFKVETWQKVLASLKPGATLLSFGGTRTYHRMTCAIEDAGAEIRDCLMWLYGQGFPKSLDISKAIDSAAGAEREVVGEYKYPDGSGQRRVAPCSSQTTVGRVSGSFDITAPATDLSAIWSGWGTALKPAYEPIVLAMKPLDGTFAENALQHGVAGLNIDGGRIPLNGDYKCGANGRPSQTGLGDNYDPAAANQHSNTGRWPANVIMDEAAGAMLDEQSGDSKSTGGRMANISTTSRIYGGGNGLGQNIDPSDVRGDPGYGDIGGASRFFYCPKAGEEDRRGSKHPTVKPVSLLEYLCLLTATPTGGTVLDPFMGTGTTMAACIRQDRPFVGIERDTENGYFQDCVDRAKHELRRQAEKLFV